MKLQAIIDNIHSRLGIAELNPMQHAVADAPSHDLVLLSPTGSGKTVAFAIAMLRGLRDPDGRVQGVVIAPSRELVVQISRVIKELASGYKVVALYGGHSMTDEKNSLTPVPDIVVATPGRLLDHVNRNQIDLYTTRTLVLDEYDKSLELGFHDEMKKVIRKMPNLARTILTSATVIDKLPDFVKLRDPLTLDFLDTGGKPRERMQIVEVECPVRDKLDTLTDLIRSLPNGRVIIFVNHRESAERVYESLRRAGLPAGLYHGALDQIDREKAIDLLNNGTTPILVSTDLGARGLDIDSVHSIIHYHLPLSEQTWTHRNGRTARVDASGTVYVLTSEADSLPDYIEFDRKYVPTGKNDNPIRPDTATLYFNSGRKEKVSRGDIAGYIIKQGNLAPDRLGRIVVKDHCALAAVPAAEAERLVRDLSAAKLKGHKVKISIMK